MPLLNMMRRRALLGIAPVAVEDLLFDRVHLDLRPVRQVPDPIEHLAVGVYIEPVDAKRRPGAVCFSPVQRRRCQASGDIECTLADILLGGLSLNSANDGLSHRILDMVRGVDDTDAELRQPVPDGARMIRSAPSQTRLILDDEGIEVVPIGLPFDKFVDGPVDIDRVRCAEPIQSDDTDLRHPLPRHELRMTASWSSVDVAAWAAVEHRTIKMHLRPSSLLLVM